MQSLLYDREGASDDRDRDEGLIIDEIEEGGRWGGAGPHGKSETIT